MIVQRRKTNAQILNKIFFLCFKSVQCFIHIVGINSATLFDVCLGLDTPQTWVIKGTFSDILSAETEVFN